MSFLPDTSKWHAEDWLMVLMLGLPFAAGGIGFGIALVIMAVQGNLQ